jgi:hypothetical protein
MLVQGATTLGILFVVSFGNRLWMESSGTRWDQCAQELLEKSMALETQLREGGVSPEMQIQLSSSALAFLEAARVFATDMQLDRLSGTDIDSTTRYLERKRASAKKNLSSV